MQYYVFLYKANHMKVVQRTLIQQHGTNKTEMLKNNISAVGFCCHSYKITENYINKAFE